jgi:hypothetical protein
MSPRTIQTDESPLPVTSSHPLGEVTLSLTVLGLAAQTEVPWTGGLAPLWTCGEIARAEPKLEAFVFSNGRMGIPRGVYRARGTSRGSVEASRVVRTSFGYVGRTDQS